jgi:predicted membrane-bound dolichyl-phosphate-mannose-protein mannosyltransferase
MFRLDQDDPLRNRRLLAMLAAFWGFFVFPVLLILANRYLKTTDGLCSDMLKYMAASVLAPIVGYLYSAHKKEGRNGTTDNH